MEMRTEKTPLMFTEALGTTVQEQGIELDHVLPDYYPDIFTLIRCFVTPTIVSRQISGDRLSYELRADVRILYCTENSHVLQCVTQVLRFSRTAELPAGEGLSAEILPEVDYVNCRAVSRRRLDIRGAVTIRIRTTATRRQEVLSDVFAKGMQLRKCPVMFPVKHLQEERSVLLSEELALGSAKPPVLHIVRCDAWAVEQSEHFVSGKLMVQGCLQIQLLYACEKDGDGALEPMSFRIPYSQLIELDGVQEQDVLRSSAEVLSCELKPVTDADGEVRLLRCDAELRVQCTAVRLEKASLVCDAFSTEHPTETERVSIPVSGAPAPLSETLVCTAKLPCEDSEPDCVYDAWCEVRSLSTELEDGEVHVSGMLGCFCLVRERSGMPKLLEKAEPFTHRFTPGDVQAGDVLHLTATAENSSYTLASASEVVLRCELHMEGTLLHCETAEVLTGVTVREEEPLPKQYALKLYYGTAGEEVWDIARRSHTSVEAVMAENGLTEETLEKSGMLLIPIVG